MKHLILGISCSAGYLNEERVMELVAVYFLLFVGASTSAESVDADFSLTEEENLW